MSASQNIEGGVGAGPENGSTTTGIIRRATRIDRLTSGSRTGRSRRFNQTIHQISRPNSTGKLGLPKSSSPCTSPGRHRADSLRSSQISIDEKSV